MASTFNIGRESYFAGRVAEDMWSIEPFVAE
jgi:hypothetical protein